MYSFESRERLERAAALEKEREEVGLSLRDTRTRVKKYDRLKKRIKTKVCVCACGVVWHFLMVVPYHPQCIKAVHHTLPFSYI